MLRQFRIFVLFAFVASLLPQAGYAAPTQQTITMPTPTSEYLFGDNSTLNTGSVSGSCSLAGNAALASDSERGMVLTLDGTGDYCSQVDAAGLTANNPFTLSAWVYDEDSGTRHVLSVGGTTNATTLTLRNVGNNSTRWAVSYNTSSGSGRSLNTPDLGNNWHHEALVYDGEELTIYYDGMAIYSVYIAGWSTNSNNLTVGSRADGAALKGKIDDVRVYAEALSPGQVQYLALGAPVETEPEQNLIQRFEFENQNPYYALDTSGRNNTGFVNQGPVYTGWLEFAEIGTEYWADTADSDLQINASSATDDVITATGVTAAGWFIDDGTNVNTAWPALLTISGGTYVSRIIYRFNTSTNAHELGIEHSVWSGEYVTVTGTLGEAVFIAYQWDASTLTERLYISTTEVYSSTYDDELLSVDTITWLGSGPYSNRHWRGQFDDLRLYNAIVDIDAIVNPPEPIPPDACGFDNTLWELFGDIPINVSSSSGTTLFQATDDFFYMVELYSGPWYNSGLQIFPQYDAQVAVNYGANWKYQEQADRLLCGVYYDDEELYYRSYYAMANGEILKYRADDTAIFFDNSGSLRARIYRYAGGDTPLPINVLRDGDMEEYPTSTSWFQTTDTGTFGRVNNAQAVHGTAKCGQGFQAIGVNNLLLGSTYAPIRQQFQWPGGEGYLSFWWRATDPVPGPGSWSQTGKVRFYNGETLVETIDVYYTYQAEWQHVLETVTLDAGTYRIQFDGNTSTKRWYVDEVIFATGDAGFGWDCAGDTPYFPTPTPTPAESSTPTVTPTITRTPTPGQWIGLINCSFESGSFGWTLAGDAHIETTGGPNGVQFALVNNSQEGGLIYQAFDHAGGDINISFWYAGNPHIVLRRLDVVQQWGIALPAVEQWTWHQETLTIDRGRWTFRIEAENVADAGMVDAVGVGSVCGNANFTPTPGTPIAYTPTATPVRATPTPTATSACSQPSDVFEVGGWAQWGFCEFTEFTAPQERHFATLEAIPTEYLIDREPFGTFAEFSISVDIVKNTILQADWSEGLRGMRDAPSLNIFDVANAPILRGEIDPTLFSDPDINVFPVCPEATGGIFGGLFTDAICFAFGILYGLGLLPWLQFVWDFLWLGILYKYFQKRWLSAQSA